MKYGFVRVAAASPTVQVADCYYNISQIEKSIKKAAEQRVQVIVFPELSITGYTCMDLFLQEALLQNAVDSLLQLVEQTQTLPPLCIVGMPLQTENRIFNVAVVFQKGKILGIVPKTYIPNHKELQEKRWFTSGKELLNNVVKIGKENYPISNNLLFTCNSLSVGIEIGEDLWATIPPSSSLCMQGANLICNLSASNELTGKNQYLRSLINQQSGRCITGYVYASAGFGESSTDLVFAGKGLIAENGTILSETERFTFKENLTITEIDIEGLQHERKMNTGFMESLSSTHEKSINKVPFEAVIPDSSLYRLINPRPFIPSEKTMQEQCEETLLIQQSGLTKRLLHTHSKTSIIGVSGGLDSTLALLVTMMTYDQLNMNRKQIIGVTMPGFGTTDRTYQNAINLMKALEISQREISIVKAMEQHFDDIQHKEDLFDTTFENSQARERTQILMDLANKENGLVIGTGDLSELALGWTTYNGDHMSMYGLNSGIPKTLIKHLVQWIASHKVSKQAADILLDIIHTPISPELTPADADGKIKQKTEELIGPYELLDFFLYYTIRKGATPEKIYFLAQQAFKELYSKEIIKKWLYSFYHRFFSQQFKRSCMPDSPKVGSVSLSPRGDWRMPSDAMATIWLKETEELN